MTLRFWRRPGPSPEAQHALREAEGLKRKRDEQARRWNDQLETNGFAEMVEGLLSQSAKRQR